MATAPLASTVTVTTDNPAVASSLALMASLLNALTSQTAAVSTVAASRSTALGMAANGTWSAADPRLTASNDTWTWIDSSGNERHPMVAYAVWTMENRDDIIASGKGEVGYFIHTRVGANSVECGVSKTHCGCSLKDVGLIDLLQRKYPNDFDMALETYRIFLAFETYFTNMCTFNEGIKDAALMTSLLGEKFAETFFALHDAQLASYCEHRQQVIDAMIGVGIFLVVGLPFDFAGAAVMEVSMAGVKALLSSGVKGLTVAERTAFKKFLTGTKFPQNMFKTVEKLKAEASPSFIPKGASWYGWQNMARFGIQNSVSKYVTDRSKQTFHDNMVSDNSCGVSNPEDKRLENAGKVEGLIKEEVELWASFIELSMIALANGTGTGDKGTYVTDEASELATHILGMFHDFDAYQAVLNSNRRPAEVAKWITESMTAGEIQKAWADQHCYFNCAPNPTPNWCQYSSNNHSKPIEGYCPKKHGNQIICQANCWEGGSVDQGNVALFGAAAIADSPWFFPMADILEASWQAYEANPNAFYDTIRSGQLIGWVGEKVGDVSQTRSKPLPLLAISFSNYTRIQDLTPKNHKKGEVGKWAPCNAGDRWGSDSQAFWNATHFSDVQYASYLVWRCRENWEDALDDIGGRGNRLGIFLTNQFRLLVEVDLVKEEDAESRSRLSNTVASVDSTVERERKSGTSEDKIEEIVTTQLCKEDEEDWWKLKYKGEDEPHKDETSKPTLRMARDKCKEWMKHH
ncbi:hypothetical protein LTR56_009991 [Elasticomyces elasticus]|nr:hypothetical protein LTR56_009991 [Elasticomyces elasticus]KAK3665072.1 hypothetical protein LTR22_004128 [Elasticomyces elasticus]KAK4931554.1 hypothetical protein LTR49_001942 [Elasticomyces elasticus]KAK5766714.1 hypothetical protein LTS12_003063 [Elasticomyces elasticus]